MKRFPIYILLIISTLSANAQDKKEGFFKKYPFVNITELGAMFGRTKYVSYWSAYDLTGRPAPNAKPYYYTNNNANLTLQTFNGVYLDKKTAVGLVTGVDWYYNVILMPVGVGIRRQIAQKKEGGSAIIASLDGGYGTTWLHANNNRENVDGGIFVNPTIGYRIPMRNGSAILLNFGYRHQRFTVETDNSYTNTINNINQEWTNISKEYRNMNRMTARLGFEF